VTLSFSGTVLFASGDLNGPVSANDTISGTITYESTTAGVYTPAGNPTFQRSEMLYSGAITDTQLSVNGTPVTGTGGGTLIFDAAESLAMPSRDGARALPFATRVRVASR